jgi:hypothetical protein
VRTRRSLSPQLENELIDATDPLFLESGRRISPSFKAAGEDIPETISSEAIQIWP